jgi:hypothetical protein
MNKRHIFSIIAFLLIAGVTAYAVHFSPGNIPFPYDQGQIVGMKMGGVSIEATDFMIVDVNCTHNKDFPFMITIVSGPPGMYIIKNGNDFILQWTPDVNQVGVHYVVIDATDIPPPPYRVKSRQGTIVIQVVDLNPGPVLWALQDSPVAMHNWPQDDQIEWQRLRKLGTIIQGPVVMDLK